MGVVTHLKPQIDMSSVAQLKEGVDQVIRRRMSVSEFAPGDEKLRFMYEYWSARRKDGLLPARRDIDILDLRPMVGQIHLLDTTTRDPARFVFRVYGSVGSRLNQGYNYTNTAIGDYPSECYRKGLIEDYGAVAFTGTPGYHHVVALLDFIKYSYSRLILPLADDGRQVDMLLVGIVKRSFKDLQIG